MFSAFDKTNLKREKMDKMNDDKYNRLLSLITDSDNEKLQNAFLDYQKEKNENNEKYLKHLESILKEDGTSDNSALNIGDVGVSLCNTESHAMMKAGVLIKCHDCDEMFKETER